MPARWIASRISSGEAVARSQGSPSLTSWLEPGNGLRKIAGDILPLIPGARAMRWITPEAGACIATDTKPSGSAISWPRSTSWPSRTTASAGLPICCDSGTTITGAKGNCFIGRSRVSSFASGG